jgi:hypothetical protein
MRLVKSAVPGPLRLETDTGRIAHLGLIRAGGQVDYAACLSRNFLSNTAGLT